MNTRSIQRAMQAHGTVGVEAMTSREPCMRVGVEFQAVVPDMCNIGSVGGVGSMKVWMPSGKVCEEDVEEYLKVAKDKFGYRTEQALGMLYWYDYSIDKALENMPHFSPLQEEWSMEDKVIFQQAFQYHGKNFQRIRTMLPEKPVCSLVRHYYLWKKSYACYSLMDKQARKNGWRLGAGLPVSNDDTDSNKSGSSHSDLLTQQPGTLLLPAPGHASSFQKGKQLPRGIYLNTHELVELSNDVDSTHLHRLDREMLELKKKVQDNKQILIMLREAAGGSESIEALRPNEYSRKTGHSAPTKWSDDEIEIALEVIRSHGKDCDALAVSLENKTVSQCRNFFTNYKRKLNLPSLIAEYEIKNGHKLSRYGRQAKELVENGGAGFTDTSQPVHSKEEEFPKRPCYDTPLLGRDVSYAIPTSQHPPRVAMTLM